MMTNDKYAIMWKHRLTNKVGMGKPIFQWKNISSIVNYCNREWPEIEHRPYFPILPMRENTRESQILELFNSQE